MWNSFNSIINAGGGKPDTDKPSASSGDLLRLRRLLRRHLLPQENSIAFFGLFQSTNFQPIFARFSPFPNFGRPILVIFQVIRCSISIGFH